MKMLQQVKAGPVVISLQDWKAMPKASKTPEGYKLVVDGKDVVHPQVQITGGGAFPVYTYLQVGEQVKWFSGCFESGTAVEVVSPTLPTKTVTEAIAAPAEPAAAPAPAAKGKKQK